MPSGFPTLLSPHTLPSGGRLRTQVWMEPALVLSGSIAVPLLFTAARRIFNHGTLWLVDLFAARDYDTMSTSPHEAAPATDEPLTIFLFDHPGADIILRSQDSYHLRVPKIYIIDSSPILGELIRKTLDFPGDANSDPRFPVIQLPESGEILRRLLTFIFPTTPLLPSLPSTPEEIMELLSVAQKYQMGTALTHIRGSISQQNSLPTSLEPALHIYALAQKYGLRPEALRSAQAIVLKQSMTIEDFGNKLDVMPGDSLHELSKYHERVRDILASDLTDFRKSRACGTITGLRCTELSSSKIPSWLDQYIESIGKSPNLFDYGGLSIAMARHVKDKADEPGCKCASISSISNFWEALASVVHGGLKKVSVVDIPSCLGMLNFLQAESALCLVRDREDPQTKIISATSPLEPFDVFDTNLIIRSSDKVDYRVHKTILAMASPFFKDHLLSLPPPSHTEVVGGLRVVQLSENSELLNTLLSILYPVRTVLPNSYEKVLRLPAI